MKVDIFQTVCKFLLNIFRISCKFELHFVRTAVSQQNSSSISHYKINLRLRESLNVNCFVNFYTSEWLLVIIGLCFVSL